MIFSYQSHPLLAAAAETAGALVHAPSRAGRLTLATRFLGFCLATLTFRGRCGMASLKDAAHLQHLHFTIVADGKIGHKVVARGRFPSVPASAPAGWSAIVAKDNVICDTFRLPGGPAGMAFLFSDGSVLVGHACATSDTVRLLPLPLARTSPLTGARIADIQQSALGWLCESRDLEETLFRPYLRPALVAAGAVLPWWAPGCTVSRDEFQTLRDLENGLNLLVSGEMGAFALDVTGGHFSMSGNPSGAVPAIVPMTCKIHSVNLPPQVAGLESCLGSRINAVLAGAASPIPAARQIQQIPSEDGCTLRPERVSGFGDLGHSSLGLSQHERLQHLVRLRDRWLGQDLFDRLGAAFS